MFLRCQADIHQRRCCGTSAPQLSLYLNGGRARNEHAVPEDGCVIVNVDDVTPVNALTGVVMLPCWLAISTDPPTGRQLVPSLNQ